MTKTKKFLYWIFMPGISLTGIFSFGISLQAKPLLKETKEVDNSKQTQNANSIPFDYFSYENDYKTLTGFAKGITLQKIRQEFYTTLQIPSYVEKIANNAFSNMFDGMSTYITTLKLNENLKIIGDNAFQGCYGFTNVIDFSKTQIEKIGNFAFENCQYIKGVKFCDDQNLTSSLQTIGASAFSNCATMQELVLPSSLQDIKNYAFDGCSGLEKIDLSNYETPPLWMIQSAQVFRYCSTDAKTEEHPIVLNGKYITLDEWKTLLSNQYEDDTVLTPRYFRATTKDCFIFEQAQWEEGYLNTCDFNSGKYDLSDFDVFVVPKEAEAIDCDLDGKWKSRPLFRIEFEEGSQLKAFAFKGFAKYLIGDIKFPDTVTSIWDYALQFSHINRVTLPNNSDLILYRPFCNCGITELIVPPKACQSSSILAYGNYLDCPYLSYIELQMPESLTSLPGPAEGYCLVRSGIYGGGTVVINCGSDPDVTKQKVQAIEEQFKTAGLCDGDSTQFFDKYTTSFDEKQKWFFTDEHLDQLVPESLMRFNNKNEITKLDDSFDDKIQNYSLLELPEKTRAINENIFKQKLISSNDNQSWIFKPNFGLLSLQKNSLANNSSTTSPSANGLILPSILPNSIKEMIDPFGDYNYNLRGVLNIPPSVEKLQNFSLENTNIGRVSFMPSLKFLSGKNGKSPFYSKKLNAICLNNFPSYEILYDVSWENNIFDLYDRKAAGLENGRIIVPYNSKYTWTEYKRLWKNAMSKFWSRDVEEIGWEIQPDESWWI